MGLGKYDKEPITLCNWIYDNGLERSAVRLSKDAIVLLMIGKCEQENWKEYTCDLNVMPIIQHKISAYFMLVQVSHTVGIQNIL